MKEIDYEHQAEKWQRDKKENIGDFTHRPIILTFIKRLGKDKIILDVGCGEGYLTRRMARFANKIIGVDKSKKMIGLALEKERKSPLGIKYYVGNIKKMSFLSNNLIDLCVGAVVINYLDSKSLDRFLKELKRVLKSNGKFIFSLPHPVFALQKIYGEALLWDVKNYDYFESRNKFFKATTKTITGKIQEVGMYHRTFEDLISAFSKKDLKITGLRETVISKKLVEKFSFLKGYEGISPYVIIVGEK